MSCVHSIKTKQLQPVTTITSKPALHFHVLHSCQIQKNMTVTRSLLCLEWGFVVCIFKLIFHRDVCCPQVHSWFHFKVAVWSRGGLAGLHQAHFRACFHACHFFPPRLPSLTGRRSRMWAPSTNYRSPCQLKGPLPDAKPLDDIINGMDRARGET